MAEDFNTAGEQRSFDVIPTGTIATLQITVRPGQAGEGGWLRRSKDGQSEGLDCEFTVVDGPYAKRKLWTLFTLGGTGDGHHQAAEISRITLRAILESARGIRPDDQSEAATKARQTDTWAEFQDLRFIARIGVEPATDKYKAKNKIDEVITPERRDWHPIEQIANKTPFTTATPATTPAPAITKPAWAK